MQNIECKICRDTINSHGVVNSPVGPDLYSIMSLLTAFCPRGAEPGNVKYKMQNIECKNCRDTINSLGVVNSPVGA